VSFGSGSCIGFPSAPHTLFMQSPAGWVVDSSPAVAFGVQNDATQIDAVQPSFDGMPQSTSPTHGVHPAPPHVPVVALVLALVLAAMLVVLDVVALLPPAEAPLTSSVHPPGATITTLASATTTLRPIARDPRAD
jgi:hypothetical protein